MAYNVNLPEKALTDIKTLAEKCDLEKVILFGSRARGGRGSIYAADV